MLAFALAFVVFAALCGWLLQRLHVVANAAAGDSLSERINAALPQLQCGDCNYPGCRPYAQAIARQEAPINLCLPGGAPTAAALAELLGAQTPAVPAAPPRKVARIRAEDCVGCGLCLPVCPTDAIVGASRHAHEVVEEDCVGCNLCLPPCPVDCIDMRPPPTALRAD